MLSWKGGFSFLIITALLFSCGDHDVKPKRGTLFPVEAGNYWVYKTTTILFDGSVQIFPYLDSVWVDDQTIDIRGNKYWILQSSLSNTAYLRDSADCAIMGSLSFQQIVYSTNRDTLVSRPPAYLVMTRVNDQVTVPAGEFTASNCMTLLKKNGSVHSDYPSFDKKFSIGEQYICSEEIGLIKHVYYYLGSAIEIELVRYKIHGIN